MIWIRMLGWGRALAKWAKAHPLLVILALSLAANWMLWARGDRYRDRLSHITTAQTQATRDQIAVNQAPARISKAIAEKSNAQAPAYYRHALAVAERHRVRATCAPGPAHLPGPNHVAEIHDGPAASAELVSRAKAEDDLILAAAARAAQMHADAQALIDAGVAISSPDQMGLDQP